MTLRQRATASGLDRTTIALLALVLGLALLHHADHVLRVDHSGWPFRDRVTPFTYSLLAYPAILFALFGAQRMYWLRWGLLLVATIAVVVAHSTLESPAMQYAMWADNRSIDPRAAGVHNMVDAASPALGLVSVGIAMALNVGAVVATVAMAARGRRLRRS